MKLWEKDTMVTLGLNFLFQKRLLQMEVVLLAEKASHARLQHEQSLQQ